MIVAILCRIDVGERHRGIRRFAVVIANYIAGDLVDPCRQTIRAMKRSEIAVNPNERLLQQIIGSMLVRYSAANELSQIRAEVRPDCIG